jgi:hypothetical protein
MARRNRGAFRPGVDPRRHVFTHEECSQGGRTSFAYLLEHKPEVLRGLRKKLALTRWQYKQRAERGDTR